jgi:hypothetical protein
MYTVTVWTLLLWSTGFREADGFAVIDNIATQQQCEAVKAVVERQRYHRAQCIGIKKIMR